MTQHLLRCKSNLDQDETIRMLLKALTPTDPHPAQYALKAGITRWLDGDDSPLLMPVDEFPTKFHASLLKAVADQNSIGWGQAMKGRLSVKWKYLLSHDMYDNTNTQEGWGPYHIRLILKAILVQSSRSFWTSRNGALHAW
jgi:hypothetical protein